MLLATYLQIALSSQLVNGKLPVDLYVDAVCRLTRAREGLFFITSCNFTKSDLEAYVVPSGFVG